MPTTFPVQLPSGRMEDQPFLTPRELSERLHISRKTVYKRIQTKTWPYTRIASKVYFSPADVAAIMDGARFVPAAHLTEGH